MSRFDELLDRWCAGSPVSRSGPAAIEVLFAGKAPVTVAIRALSDDEVELSATWSPPDAPGLPPIDRLADATTMMAAGMLRCEANSTSVAITMPLYLEGLSRQEFLNAAAEIARAHWMLEASALAGDEERAGLDSARASLAELEAFMTETKEAAGRLDAFEAAGTWAPTHIVPDGGLPAWTQPDGSVAATATLAAGVELRLQEVRGDWASVVASNGWTGWVDARRIVARS